MPAATKRSRSSPPEELPSEPSGEQQSLLSLFRQHLLAGSYDALIGQGLRSTLRGAAADTGLEAEIGALRLALVRLLNEERDPSRLAAGVSRVAGVAIQAARLRSGPDVDLEQIRAFMLGELDAIERELALAASQPKEIHRDAV